jgi:hypothetical protein
MAQHSGPCAMQPLQAALAVASTASTDGAHAAYQDIVRITFKAFHDVLKAQGEAIKTLERALESKAASSDVASALQHKANTTEVAQRLRDVRVPPRLLLPDMAHSLVDTQSINPGRSAADGQSRRGRRGPPCFEVRTRCLIEHPHDGRLRRYQHQGGRCRDQGARLQTQHARKPSPPAGTHPTNVQVWKEQVERSQQQARGEMVQLGSGLHDIAGQVDQKANTADVSEALATKADAADVEEALRDKVPGRKPCARSAVRGPCLQPVQECDSGTQSSVHQRG